ncbi:unnamed protein product [Ectocarpus sp. CCAP 1310/34]|nr:unnamed protein product [Ectocarpus sp. CCAP 1310/34]
MTTMAIMRYFYYTDDDFIPLKIDNDGDRFCFKCRRAFWKGETIEIIPPHTVGNKSGGDNYAWIGRKCRYSCEEGARVARDRATPRQGSLHFFACIQLCMHRTVQGFIGFWDEKAHGTKIYMKKRIAHTLSQRACDSGGGTTCCLDRM